MKKNVIAFTAAALMLSLTACGTTTTQTPGITPNDAAVTPGTTEVPRLRSTDSELEYGRTANHYGNNAMNNGRYVAYPDGAVSPINEMGRTMARGARTAADRTRTAMDDVGYGMQNAANDMMH